MEFEGDVKFKNLINKINSGQKISIYVKDEDSFHYSHTGISLNKHENLSDNQDVMRYEDYYVWDIWAMKEEEIRVILYK